jgi:flagellar biosynthesis protein FlhF
MGRFEVIFGVLESRREDVKIIQTPVHAPPVPAGRDDLAAELKMLRSQITDLRKMLQPSPQPAPAAIESENVRNELIAADLDPVIAANLVDAAETRWGGAGKQSLQQIVEECVRARIQTAHDLKSAAVRGNVIAFVGPPGAGKTTALAKIAVQCCFAKRRSVRIVSVDTERVGGHELLRAYSNLLGIGFVAVNSLAALQEALNENSEKMYVLIDTPGFAPADAGAARDLATVLGRAAGAEVHLVMPASMKRPDAAAYSDFFAVFKPTRLLFTKLDETASVGSLLSEALRIGIPLSFFSIGQAVPEDLENADPDALIGRLFPPTEAPAATAA